MCTYLIPHITSAQLNNRPTVPLPTPTACPAMDVRHAVSRVQLAKERRRDSFDGSKLARTSASDDDPGLGSLLSVLSVDKVSEDENRSTTPAEENPTKIIRGEDVGETALVRADLSFAMLTGDFSGKDLHGALLIGAVMRKAIFCRSVLAKCNMEGADLSGADFTRADLRSANLSGALLVGATLRFACLNHAKMVGAIGCPVERKDFRRGAGYASGKQGQQRLKEVRDLRESQRGGMLWEDMVDQSARILQRHLRQFATSRHEATQAVANLGRNLRSKDNLVDMTVTLAANEEADEAAVKRMDDWREKWRRSGMAQDQVERLVDMQEAVMHYVDMQAARLSRANLYGIRCCGANMGGAQLNGAQLEQSRFEECRLVGTSLEKASLSFAQLCMLDLSSVASLQHAELRGASLVGSRLANCRLRGLNLLGADLSFVNFRNSDLRGACMAHTLLVGANFQKARLDKANLVECVGSPKPEGQTWKPGGPVDQEEFVSPWSADDEFVARTEEKEQATLRTSLERPQRWRSAMTHNVREAQEAAADHERVKAWRKKVVKHNKTLERSIDQILDLQRASLRGTLLTGSFLVRVHLAKADMTNADLQQATLNESCLEGAIFDNCNLTGTGLFGAHFRKFPVPQRKKMKTDPTWVIKALYDSAKSSADDAAGAADGDDGGGDESEDSDEEEEEDDDDDEEEGMDDEDTFVLQEEEGIEDNNERNGILGVFVESMQAIIEEATKLIPPLTRARKAVDNSFTRTRILVKKNLQKMSAKGGDAAFLEVMLGASAQASSTSGATNAASLAKEMVNLLSSWAMDALEKKNGRRRIRDTLKPVIKILRDAVFKAIMISWREANIEKTISDHKRSSEVEGSDASGNDKDATGVDAELPPAQVSLHMELVRDLDPVRIATLVQPDIHKRSESLVEKAASQLALALERNRLQVATKDAQEAQGADASPRFSRLSARRMTVFASSPLRKLTAAKSSRALGSPTRAKGEHEGARSRIQPDSEKPSGSEFSQGYNPTRQPPRIGPHASQRQSSHVVPTRVSKQQSSDTDMGSTRVSTSLTVPTESSLAEETTSAAAAATAQEGDRGVITLAVHSCIDLDLRPGDISTKTLVPYEIVGPPAALDVIELVVGSRTFSGELSPLASVTLNADECLVAGISADAKSFAFAYPRKNLSLEAHNICLSGKRQSGIDVMLFLTFGGFVYFDSEHKVLQLNALAPEGDEAAAAAHLTLVGPGIASEHFMTLLHVNRRLQPVTLGNLVEAGFRKFGWVHPNEHLRGTRASDEIDYPAGVFVYSMRDGPPVMYVLAMSTDQHLKTKQQLNAQSAKGTKREGATEAAEKRARQFGLLASTMQWAEQKGRSGLSKINIWQRQDTMQSFKKEQLAVTWQKSLPVFIEVLDTLFESVINLIESQFSKQVNRALLRSSARFIENVVVGRPLALQLRVGKALEHQLMRIPEIAPYVKLDILSGKLRSKREKEILKATTRYTFRKPKFNQRLADKVQGAETFCGRWFMYLVFVLPVLIKWAFDTLIGDTLRKFVISPQDMRIHVKEIEYLQEQLQAVADISATQDNWSEFASAWEALLLLRSHMEAERGQAVLECIVLDEAVLRGLGSACVLRNMAGTDPPDGLLKLVKSGPAAHIKLHAYKYQLTLEDELVRITALRNFQERVMALIGTGIFALQVALFNMLGRYVYYTHIADDPDALSQVLPATADASSGILG